MKRSSSTTRVSVSLVCTTCGSRNYKTTRAKRPGAKPVELRKHCPHCNAHTVHRESK